jgi:hypothetical protein
VCVWSAEGCDVCALEACVRPAEKRSSHNRLGLGVRRAFAHRQFPRCAPPSRAHGRQRPLSLLDAGAEIVRLIVVYAEGCYRCLASVFPCATRLSGSGTRRGGERVQTAALSCPAKRMSEVAIGMRVVYACSSRCIARVAVGRWFRVSTRGPGPGLREGLAGWQTGQAQKNGTLQLNCVGLHGLGKPVTTTVRQGRDDLTTLLLATALLSALPCSILLARVLSKPKPTDTPRQQQPRCRLRQKKPGRLDASTDPARHWPREIAMGSGCVIRVALITCGIVPCAHQSWPYPYDGVRTQATNGQACILGLPNEKTNGGVFKRE